MGGESAGDDLTSWIAVSNCWVSGDLIFLLCIFNLTFLYWVSSRVYFSLIDTCWPNCLFVAVSWDTTLVGASFNLSLKALNSILFWL